MIYYIFSYIIIVLYHNYYNLYYYNYILKRKLKVLDLFDVFSFSFLVFSRRNKLSRTYIQKGREKINTGRFCKKPYAKNNASFRRAIGMGEKKDFHKDTTMHHRGIHCKGERQTLISSNSTFYINDRKYRFKPRRI